MIDLRDGRDAAVFEDVWPGDGGGGDTFGLVPLVAMATPTCLAMWAAIAWGVLRLTA